MNGKDRWIVPSAAAAALAAGAATTVSTTARHFFQRFNRERNSEKDNKWWLDDWYRSLNELKKKGMASIYRQMMREHGRYPPSTCTKLRHAYPAHRCKTVPSFFHTSANPCSSWAILVFSWHWLTHRFRRSISIGFIERLIQQLSRKIPFHGPHKDQHRHLALILFWRGNQFVFAFHASNGKKKEKSTMGVCVLSWQDMLIN